jgi:hypothetical protein
MPSGTNFSLKHMPIEQPTSLHPQEQVLPVPQPRGAVVVQSMAFALSALLSPYLVIPIGTTAIVASVAVSRKEWLIWTLLSVLFSTVIPALYVVVQIWRGKITDVHVMEREQRGGPFLIAIISSALGALVLRRLGADVRVWGIGAVLAANGVALLTISRYWKISMHVAVLSATVLAATIMIEGVSLASLAWMIPALIWARLTRGRHSLWQGVAGCVIASSLTAIVLRIVYAPYVADFWPHFFRRLE